jgi:predicted enzyme related to lactoylglutathione lyase
MTQDTTTPRALGLATVIYQVPDLDRAKAWYTTAFGLDPYFDQPFYVGFEIGGYELGLHPDLSEGEPGPGGSVAYWRVPRIGTAVEHFLACGASLVSPATEVGEGITVARVADPFGNVIGLIENPHFKA